MMIDAFACALLALAARPQEARPPLQGFPGLPTGYRPRVEIAWNRFYDDVEIDSLMARLAAQWPKLMREHALGSSVEGRPLRLWILGDESSGSLDDKPAMWVDGNIHGNEVQGAEAVVYLAWYLLENSESNPEVAALLRRASFHLLPMVNPDGRARWFKDAHNASSSRTGAKPTDDDDDGRLDEDGPNDLDGDGHIAQMRKHMPGQGTHRLDPDDPRVMIPVPPNDEGRRGDWILLGSEGFDDDGDGRVDEDGVGGYDMNRAWPSMWEPEHVQRGAGPYPLHWPETRAIAEWIAAKPGIAAVQSFHNMGGMILRGPGAEGFGSYEPADVRVYDELGREGELMLPFYRYMVIWKDLYTVYGGFVTWTYEGLGIISFTNELWNDDQMHPERSKVASGPLASGDKQRRWFDDNLLSGAGFVDWRPVDHPVHGAVEVGGWRKDTGRVPPSFLIEEMLHRNALFCIAHAEAMPEVSIEEPQLLDLGDGLKALDVVVRNKRAIPTRTAQAAKRRIGLMDSISLEGEDVEVLAAGVRGDRFRPDRIELAEREPAVLRLEQGIPGRGEVRVRFYLRGEGRRATIWWRGEKARDARRDVPLD
jgi:hypothetical protein